MEGKHKTPVPPIEPATFDDFSKSFFASLVQCTKAAQFLKAEELPFYKANSSEFATSLEHTSESVLSLCNRLMRHASKGFGVDSSGSDLVGVGFEDVDDMVDRFDAVVDVVDNLLEKADVCFDEVLGTAGQRGAASVPTQSSPMVVQMSVGGSRNQKKDVTVVHAQNIIRPQLKFEDKIDNSNRPFVRKLAVKHNALRPLDYGLSSSGLISDEMAAHLKSMGITDATSANLPHPYQYEIENISYPERMFKQSPEILYSSLDETPLTYIDTKEQLMAALPIIESASELAIDLEHHDYRSFQGFVCLMQISTRSEDFIIDTLAVRSYMHLLNQALSDPQIIKVFHGAESDIIWLQRDFGVYVVNMFDTYHASHLLECSAHSLAHLLKTYCDVATDKKYQLADWRIRPIPAEMLKYARIDTHYLLYIYDRMRNELIEQGNPSTHNLMHAVLQRSKVTSLNLYQKEIYDFESGEGPGGWRKPLESYGFSMNAEQLAVFKAVHAWRDHTAREEDESTRYVCPMHMLYAIADRMPTDSAGVLSCCNPVPPLVRMYASDIALLIERTRTEARMTMELREKELARLKNDLALREKEYEERKRRGPVHTRFSDGKEDEDAATDEGKGAVGSAKKGAAIKPKGTPAPKAGAGVAPMHKDDACQSDRLGDFGSGRPRIAIAEIKVKSLRADFGSLEAGVAIVKNNKKAQAKSESIRSSLYLISPGIELLKREQEALQGSDEATGDAAEEPVEDKPAPKLTKKDIESQVAETKSILSQKHTPIIMSEIKKERSTSNPKGGSARKDGVVKLEQDGVVKFDQDDNGNDLPDDTKTGSSAAKGKKKAATSDTPQPAAFDYSQQNSSIHDLFQANKPNVRKRRDTEDGADVGPAKKSATAKSEVFDPYSVVDEKPELLKKDVRGSLKPKSGIKSMTYKK